MEKPSFASEPICDLYYVCLIPHLPRSASLDLSGNKAHPALDVNGNASKHHVMMYTADAVRSTVGLTRGALLLFALLAGGDYQSRSSNATVRNEQQLQAFLVGWRAEINAELCSNSRGHLKQRHTSLTIPPDFPDLEVLVNYASRSGPQQEHRRWRGQLRNRYYQAEFSDWGHRSAIIKRFRTLLWQSAVMHILRRAALLADDKERENLMRAGAENPVINAPLQPTPSDSVGTPASLVRRSLGFADPNARFAAAFVNKGTQNEVVPDTHPLLVKVVGTRSHVSTDALLEFRVEVCPHQLAALADSGIKGTREAPDASDQNMRMWIPAVMLQQVHPALVDDYFEKPARGKGKGKARDDESDSGATVTPPAAKRRR
ncbi:hypothetical protein B0H17DRAFT_1140524 [Mycena rosella]|uniref:Holliday junction resolvase Gen1 C-terminal domain-containing protein n=1 Tax=Mycena rosella TaxID=1033263 RepID=A0AAD7D265_MYCRO|nr:hypothetical protein B0H17DRAFT_1140524 [Mycena rosella]